MLISKHSIWNYVSNQIVCQNVVGAQIYLYSNLNAMDDIFIDDTGIDFVLLL